MSVFSSVLFNFCSKGKDRDGDLWGRGLRIFQLLGVTWDLSWWKEGILSDPASHTDIKKIEIQKGTM